MVKGVIRAKKNNLLVRLHGPISPQASHWAKNDKRKLRGPQKVIFRYLNGR